ncbi:hypothetical protein [Rhizobium sp. L1K21]|uniref:hypothetical protein n=1 Tax=Rhizobium sp. L1K21 TaxID=2954933 RepID=UPI0020929E60|nr:hypothetical protein [Rhizobium sp. L1K21]MCO6184822.1 hypothetical protein [Rhizobium sp. L1K21]
MSEDREVDIRALRQIGWDYWDPIGIRQLNDIDWRTNAADEYDTYLLRAAHLLMRGETPEGVAQYLDQIGSENMGLGPVNAASHQASLRTAEAIVSYLRVWTDF